MSKMQTGLHSAGSSIVEAFRLAISDHYTLLLMLITSAGLFLRLFHLGSASMSMDETVDLFLASLSISDTWAYIASGFIFHPPLFYWVQHFILFFGTGEFVIRLPAALYGTLTIPVVYVLGKEIHSRDTGVLAAAVLAFSPFHIFYSQDARPYSMMLLFCSIALVYFVRAMKTDHGSAWALFGIVSGLAIWIVFYSVVLTFSLILYAVFERRERILKGFDENRALFVGGIFFLIIIMPLGGMIKDLYILRAVSDVTWGLKGFSIVTESYLDFFSHDLFLIVLSILLLGAGIFGLYRYDPKKGILLSTMIAVPFAISMAASYKLAIEPRYALIVLPALCVGIAMSASVVYEAIRAHVRISRLGVLVIFLLLLAVLSIPPVTSVYSSTVKFNQDWRNMSATVQGMTGPGDVIVVIPPYMARPFDYYYQSRQERTHELTASSVPDLEYAYGLKGSRRMVVVEDADHTSPAMQWVEKHGQYHFSEGEVALYIIR